MDGNVSVFITNVTLDPVMNFHNRTNVTNSSEVYQIHLFNLYEAYNLKEREQLLLYKWIAYLLGSLIVISNLTVVISSGLILRKGQQHKSTYLLLGNVSLADTLIGFSIILGASVNLDLASNQLCIFQLGMLVCPAIVSIFSVGLIAVDRYIYILHGLYYQRWFNTTRVRIGIICIWIIGICLGYMPVMGWVNHEPFATRCYYADVYPGPLVLFNSLLSMIPLTLVAILYTIILVHALRNVRKIKAMEKSVKSNPTNLDAIPKTTMRINRGSADPVNDKCSNFPTTICQLKRSASFNLNDCKVLQAKLALKSKSTDDVNISTINSPQAYANSVHNKTRHESNFSVYTIESSYSNVNSSSDVTETPRKNTKCFVKSIYKKHHKVRRPNKWRAVTIVMLTTCSFIITWMPFFVIVTIFEFCEDKIANPKCMHLRTLLVGPIAMLAFVNSVLNPLIYAWWHKGFKKSIKKHFRDYVQRCFFSSLTAHYV